MAKELRLCQTEINTKVNLKVINIADPEFGIVMLIKLNVKENGFMVKESLGSVNQSHVKYFPTERLLTPLHWHKGIQGLYTVKVVSYTEEHLGKMPSKRVLVETLTLIV